METLPGQIVTYETRREANDSVDKEKRYRQIIYILKRFPEGLSAKEIAVQMCKLGYTPTAERNFAAPRLTELSQRGIVEPFKKDMCKYTGSKVSIFRLIGEPKQMTIGDFI